MSRQPRAAPLREFYFIIAGNVRMLEVHVRRSGQHQTLGVAVVELVDGSVLGLALLKVAMAKVQAMMPPFLQHVALFGSANGRRVAILGDDVTSPPLGLDSD